MMQKKETVLLPSSEDALIRAGKVVREGGLVAFPTETVYGLGANAFDDNAVARIFEAKGRPQFNPLIVHVADLSCISDFAVVTPLAEKLVKAFMPGPITLVMKRVKNSPVSYLVSAGLDSVAVRMPAHKTAREFIRQAGVAVAAPSANVSGTLSPTTAQHVFDGLNGRIDMIIDDGMSTVGIESTVLDVCGEIPVLLRAGGLATEKIKQITGDLLYPEKDEALPRSPGQMLSHYAPSLPVRLNALKAQEGEALLGFGKSENAVLNLSEKGDTTEAAGNLFAYLRLLDDNKKYKAIAVMPIPTEGLGLGINDRLKRAAYPRRTIGEKR